MRVVLALLTSLVGCTPSTATIDTGGLSDEPADPDAPSLSCADAPEADGLEPSDYLVLYEGPMNGPAVFESDTVVIDTAVQREWVTVEGRWAPDGMRWGNLDEDPENAGHGVLLAAYRSSTCGMTVQDVRAWRVPDEEGTTYVELRVEDSSGGCDTGCDMEQWVGVALAVPIADFPFSGPVVGCVEVTDACE